MRGLYGRPQGHPREPRGDSPHTAGIAPPRVGDDSGAPATTYRPVCITPPDHRHGPREEEPCT
jgi:hypothetical protein